MTNELDELFDAAVQLPPADRAAFVEAASVSDETVRAELRSLIAEAERAERFFANLGEALKAPPVLADAVDDVPEEGAVIGRYRILGCLGRGGMGTVYRALDTRLDREVALKFFNRHVTGDADARLISEARAAAALQHPNICVIHEIGETQEGKPFIAMALCEGETLRQRLAAGAIPPDEAVSIAVQLARALGAAHARGVTHRDVKPGNIIVAPDGTAKLLDFGLARSSDVPGTHPGSTRGTVSYMSPEQIRGEPVDQRSDLWSLGVVLYEMLAGHRPFRGESDRVILQSILHEEPARLPVVGAAAPAQLVAVVERLLRKDRDSRYATAGAVLTDLAQVIPGDVVRVQPNANRPLEGHRAAMLVGAATLLVALIGVMVWSGERRAASRLVAATSGRAEPSIAVLPLANLSADPLDAAFAVGVTEELNTTLASAGGVRVIASTSTAAFKDRTMDVRQIGDSLDVSHLLEGSIRKSGSKLRVEVRLIAAEDGSTLWSQAYDREFKDMFSVQDEIVRAVASELNLRFDRVRQLRRHRPRNITAYELYVRGSDPLLLRSESGVWKALEYFQRAIAADSTYAAAHAGLALVQVRRTRLNDPGMPLPAVFALADSAARRAVALDDSLPEAHYVLGRVMEATLDFPSAEREIRRAIALDPTRAIYHRWLATLHGWARRPEEQLVEARRALETDPLNPYAHVGVAEALAANHRFDEALAQLDRLSAMKPPLQSVAFVAAQCLASQGRQADAIALLRPQADAGDPLFRAMLGYMLARAGQRDEANRLLADLIARRERTGVGAFQVAVVHAGLGDLEKTFTWLDESVDDLSMLSVIMGPTFEWLHRDPRFQKLNERLGLR